MQILLEYLEASQKAKYADTEFQYRPDEHVEKIGRILHLDDGKTAVMFKWNSSAWFDLETFDTEEIRILMEGE